MNLRNQTPQHKIWFSTINIRKILAKNFREQFSKYYSVVDDPMEVPVQVFAYNFVLEKYLIDGDRVLDVGSGLGYGLDIMAKRAGQLFGLDIDRKAIQQTKKLVISSKVKEIILYDGYNLPYKPRSMDVVTCIDVLEHVSDYFFLLKNLCIIAKRTVIISTPNRRPEYTLSNGLPKNPWHLREWNFKELDKILQPTGYHYEWNFINGPWEGPFYISNEETIDTIALTPAIIIYDSK